MQPRGPSSKPHHAKGPLVARQNHTAPRARRQTTQSHRQALLRSYSSDIGPESIDPCDLIATSNYLKLRRCLCDGVSPSAIDVVLGTTASKSHAALGVSVVRSHGRKGTEPPLKASDLPGPSVKTERPSGPLRQNETPSISPSKLRPSQGPYYPPLLLSQPPF